MRADEEESDFPTLESLVQQIAHREEVAQRLAHLLAVHQQMSRMHPMLHERSAPLLQPRPFTLCDLVLVVREGEVFASQMKIEAGPQKRHAHGGTFDMPSGSSFAPRAFPEHDSVTRNPGLPQREIGQVVLVVGVARDPLGLPLCLRIERHQLPITTTAAPVFVDAEIDRSISRPVGDAPLLQSLNQVDDLRDVVGGFGQMVRLETGQGGQIG